MIFVTSIYFSLEEEEGYYMVEGVEMFKYLGRTLYQRDDNWPELGRNIMHTRSIWGRPGTLLQRKGADPRVPEMFYRAVAQAILLYGLYTWVVSAEMEKKVEGEHTAFLRQITGK